MTAGLGFCFLPAETGFAGMTNISFCTVSLELAKHYHYSSSQLKDIEKLIAEHKDEIISAWEKYFKN